MTIRVGSLFSGYDGIGLALGEVFGDTELAWWSDIDDGAIRIMSHHHPGVPNLGDISAVDWSSVERVDVMTGGFPCQDISTAGKRAGIRPGTRSGLWTQMAYAIDQLRPRLVVIENVRNLTNATAHSDVEPCTLCVGDPVRADVLRALGAVLGDLADLGFDAEWVGLPASGVGAAHERWREFIVAYPGGQPWRFELGDRGDAAATDGLGHERSGGARRRRDGSADCRLLPTPMTEPDTGNGHARNLGKEVSDLFPTPSVADSEGGHLTRSGSRSDELLLPGVAKSLALMPTPRATDGDKGGPNQRGSSGDLMLPSAITLLPTPAVNDMGEGKTVEAWDEWTAAMKAKHGNGNGHGNSLSIEAQRVAVPDRWGKYAPAIARHEAVFGRVAPAPTQPSSKGTPQLSPRFSEWLMGLPEGHITDPAIWDGMTDKKGRPASASAKRNAQLKAAGNGVVPRQCAEAVRICLRRAREDTP